MSYILPLLAASFAAAMVELLAPRGEGGKLAAAVRMCAGLFLLVSLLTPLRAGIALLSDLADEASEIPGIEIDAPDASDYESTLQASLVALGEHELHAWVCETLQTRFAIPPDHVEVIFVWADTPDLPPPLGEVCLVVSGTAIFEDPHPIESYFTATLGIPCRVSVDVSPAAQ